jgi:hypothetical protein
MVAGAAWSFLEEHMNAIVAQANKPLIVRYQMLCDDTGGNIRDEKRMSELVCSLTSLKLYVAPFIKLQVVIYTLTEFMPRISQILSSFGFAEHSVLDMTHAEDERFAETVRHCSAVDRICIRRMLADFSLLPSDQFRLLLGTDIIFLRPPEELISFVKNPDREKVLYMVDNLTFGENLYRLTYHSGNILAGLLGDFYCLAPGVSIAREAIQSCLHTIDSWPPAARWRPHPNGMPLDYAHACEQQAAAILLADFPATQLPTSSYRHVAVARDASPSFRQYTLLHAHCPWTLILKHALPNELAESTRQNWRNLGLKTVSQEATWPWAIIHIAPRKMRRILDALALKMIFKRNNKPGEGSYLT